MTAATPERPPFPDLVIPPYGLLPPMEAAAPRPPWWQRIGRRGRAVAVGGGVLAMAGGVYASSLGDRWSPPPPAAAVAVPPAAAEVRNEFRSEPVVPLELYQMARREVPLNTRITAGNFKEFFETVEGRPGQVQGKVHAAKDVVDRYVVKPIVRNLYLTTDLFAAAPIPDEPAAPTPPAAERPTQAHDLTKVTPRGETRWRYSFFPSRGWTLELMSDNEASPRPLPVTHY